MLYDVERTNILLYYVINEYSLRKGDTPISLNRIKQESIKLFAQNGYEGTSIKDITQIIGIKPSALYSHFKSKEELFVNVLSECWDTLMEKIEKIIENKNEKNISQILYEIHKHYFNFYKEDKERTIFLLHSFMFPPIKLKKITLDIYLKRIMIINQKLIELFELGINKGLIKKISIEDHLKMFTHVIRSYYFDITALNKDISIEDFELTWDQYWNQIKTFKIILLNNGVGGELHEEY